MLIDIAPEIYFKTARSGGKGGQNVNKVETMAIAIWNIEASVLINDSQKEVLYKKLTNKISKENKLIVKAQNHRSQLSNKEAALRKINLLVHQALAKKKDRRVSRPTKASIEKRLQNKKIEAQKKKSRSRVAHI